MEDLCNKNRQDGKQVFQFSTKMRLFVILLDVIKTKSPLATNAILWSAKVNNTGFFFSFFDCNVRFSLFLFLVLLLLFVAAYLRCVWKNGQYQFHFMGGGGKAKDPCEYLRASQHCVSFCEHQLWYAS